MLQVYFAVCCVDLTKLVVVFSALKMFKETGEIFVQKPGEDVPKVFTFDSVYDWK